MKMIKATLTRTIYYSPDFQDMNSFYFIHGQESLEDVIKFDKDALESNAIDFDDLVVDPREVESTYTFEIVDTIK